MKTTPPPTSSSFADKVAVGGMTPGMSADTLGVGDVASQRQTRMQRKKKT